MIAFRSLSLLGIIYIPTRKRKDTTDKDTKQNKQANTQRSDDTNDFLGAKIDVESTRNN
jgi:hypothetical protein